MEETTNGSERYPSLLPAGDDEAREAISLKRSLTMLGTRDDAHVQLKSHTVSRTHAVIVLEPWGAYIHDLASREGVYVNRQQIHDTDLEDGDEIRIGRFEFIFQAGGLDPSLGPARPAPAAHLRMAKGRIPLAQRVTSIGRRQGMDVVVEDEAVSSTHALIYVYQGRHVLRDVSSRTGVIVDGRPINKKIELRGGEMIRIGPANMRYVLEAAGRPPLAESEPVDEGMSAAMMEVAEKEERDSEQPGDAQLREAAQAVAEMELDASPEPAAPEPKASAPIVETEPFGAADTAMAGTAVAIAEPEAEVVASDVVAGDTAPIAKELHHVIIRPAARSSLAISAAAVVVDRCPARLLAANEHPLVSATFVDLELGTVVIDEQRPARVVVPERKPARRTRPTVAKPAAPRPSPAAARPQQVKPEKSKYTESGEYRIDFDDDDDDKDPRAAMQRTAVSFMQDSIIGMPIAEVEAAPDPYTLGDVFRPTGPRLPGLILSYRLAASGSGPNRRPPTMPPRIPPAIPPRPAR